VIEEIAHELPAAPGDIGPTHAGRREGPAHGVDGVIMEFMEAEVSSGSPV